MLDTFLKKSGKGDWTIQDKKVIFAAILGNALEFYDYTIYAFFASILALRFFPSDDLIISLMATFGVYATGFILRPAGGILLGRIGDLYGRKKALEISILLMIVPTLCIGLLPTYDQAGALAPLLLVLMRMSQGISVGGEIVGSYAFLAEHAGETEKGYVSSFALIGTFGGKWIGTLVAALMTAYVSGPILEEWGWRVPFIGGIFFALAGYHLRKKVGETPIFEAMKRENLVIKSPVKETLITSTPSILLGIGCLVIHTAGLHLLFIYLPTYLNRIIGLSYTESFLSNLLALTAAMLMMPLSAKLSDKAGRLRVLMWGMLSLSILIIPAFIAISQGSRETIIFSHLSLALAFGFMHGPFPSFFMELFPSPIRYTATAISYNVGVVVFGGLSPVVVTWLIGHFETRAAPGAWLLVCAGISLGSMLWIKNTKKEIAEVPV